MTILSDACTINIVIDASMSVNDISMSVNDDYRVRLQKVA
jgi:hypothetical protein